MRNSIRTVFFYFMILSIISWINHQYGIPQLWGKIQEEFPELAHARLLSIFILSEQTDIDLIFGLEFGLREDSEHGRGLKFSLNSLEILEYGIGEVAYY